MNALLENAAQAAYDARVKFLNVGYGEQWLPWAELPPELRARERSATAAALKTLIPASNDMLAAVRWNSGVDYEKVWATMLGEVLR